jgi:PAS domain S-box-containing protein
MKKYYQIYNINTMNFDIKDVFKSPAFAVKKIPLLINFKKKLRAFSIYQKIIYTSLVLISIVIMIIGNAILMDEYHQQQAVLKLTNIQEEIHQLNRIEIAVLEQQFQWQNYLMKNNENKLVDEKRQKQDFYTTINNLNRIEHSLISWSENSSINIDFSEIVTYEKFFLTHQKNFKSINKSSIKEITNNFSDIFKYIKILNEFYENNLSITKIDFYQSQVEKSICLIICIFLNLTLIIAFYTYINRLIGLPVEAAIKMTRLIAKNAKLNFSSSSSLKEILNEISQYIQTLEKNQAAHQALLSAVPDLMLRISKTGDYLDFNPPKNFDLLVPNRQLIGQNIYNILPYSVAEERMQYIHKALTTQEPQVYEYSIVVGANNHDYEARIVVSGIDEVLVIIRDITLDKQAKQISTRLAAIIEATPEFVGTCDKDGKLVYINHAGRNLLGISQEEDISNLDISQYYPNWVKNILLKEGLPTAINQGSWSGEAGFLTRNQQEIPVLFMLIAHKDIHNQVEFISYIARDITEIKVTQKSLQNQAKELGIALNELKETGTQLIHKEKMSSLGQMVAGIAHEFNNPISFIYGNVKYVNEYIQNLLDLVKLYKQEYPKSNPAIQEKIKDIDLDFLESDLPSMMLSMQTGAERIKSLVLSLRNFARLDEGEIKKVNLHEGIDNTLLLLNHRLKHGIDIIKNYGKLPYVECFPAQLNQVFLHLLNNAIDAVTEQDYCLNKALDKLIFISTSIVKNNLIEVRIKDNGGGISNAIQDKIFDPFFTTKPVGKATGLGLAISYQIIQKHQGSIRINSQSHQGCEFVICIPIQQQV